ncbi:four helix bundle protein [Botrimarina sp.]|uniref:four helix bundle protein n=1 Tax=Botrimarina sp. TaxID=2795802 RepID=UPI0032F06910
MRDHTKLRAFELADELALATYRATAVFPGEERFGLVSLMRRAAVSTASNIVEGCARNGEADYIRFLDMAHGSVHELEYQITLAHRLGFLSADAFEPLKAQAAETAKVLNGLLRALRRGRSGGPPASGLQPPA